MNVSLRNVFLEEVKPKICSRVIVLKFGQLLIEKDISNTQSNIQNFNKKFNSRTREYAGKFLDTLRETEMNELSQF